MIRARFLPARDHLRNGRGGGKESTYSPVKAEGELKAEVRVKAEVST